ncbi:MAG: endonuclease/exonuclease/phosphatase family protein [Clostridium sp.]
MRVMTFNLRCDFILDFKNRWDNRKDIVYEILSEYDCDVIGVQELTPRMHKDISSALDGFNIVGSPRSKRFFMESNDILIAKRHKVESHKTFWLSETPDKVGSRIWYSMFPRICTTSTITLENGKKIRIYNTHLDVLLPKAREYGLRKIGEFIESEHKKDGIPVVLMGDFNATPNSKLIREFQEKGLSSKSFIAVQEKNKALYNKSTMSSFNGKEEGLHIDYIFVSEEIEIVDVKILTHNKDGRYPSDHYPIIADLRFKTP